jgi:hypothetical protein
MDRHRDAASPHYAFILFKQLTGKIARKLSVTEAQQLPTVQRVMLLLLLFQIRTALRF